MSPRDTRICLLIPALNEEENLTWLLPEIRDRYRVIVIDNGSKDGTASVVHRHGCELVDCPRRGYGNTMLAGLAWLSKQDEQPDVVVIFDADGSSPVSGIDQVSRPILAGEKDMVIAQRTAGELGAVLWHARFGNALSVFLIRLFTGYKYRDLGPLRGLRLRSLRQLGMVDRTWGWNVEMQMKAVWQGLRIGEIDIYYKKRRFGKSTISGSVIGSVRAGTRILSRIFYFQIQHRTQTMLGAWYRQKNGNMPKGRQTSGP